MAKEEPRSLKRQNRAPLAGVLLGNWAACAAVIRGDSLLESARTQPIDVLRSLLPATAAMLAVSVLNGQLSANAKARVVFMRWADPLPGARAFSVYAKSDSRIDIAALAQRFGPFPSAPREQNALWYKLYRSIESEVQVRDANQQFLLWRDCAAVVLLLAVTLVPVIAILTRHILPAVMLLTLLGLQFGLAVRAARVNGERLVTNVLALKGAEESTPQ